jgi:ADP-ribose pyrophosphatase YjhB (NUDIX family)
MNHQFWLSDEDFFYIYSKVPRFNIDLVVRKGDEGIVLIKRAIEPYLGAFHMPGGTVYKGESFKDASIRIAKNETGFEVDVGAFLGAMEFPEEKRGDIVVHTVSIVIEVKVNGGEIRKDANAEEIGLFKTLPENLVDEHFRFLKEYVVL